jgi:hypothetical protein
MENGETSGRRDAVMSTCDDEVCSHGHGRHNQDDEVET